MSDVRIEDHSNEFFDKFDDKLEKALTEIGIHIAGEAQEELENSPHRVDTGLLRNSITYALDGEPPAISTYTGTSTHGNTETTRKNKVAGKPAPPPRSGTYSGTAPKEGGRDRSVMIGTNISYGIFVHEGTSKMAPNRFLKNAVERNKDQIKAKLDEATKDF